MALAATMEFIEDEAGQTKNGFSWENRYTQSWEILKEDEDGTLETSLASIQKSQYIARRKKLAEKILRRGILRNLCIIADFSKASNEQDYSPSRGKVLLNGIKKFSKSFYDQNPLSQLGVVGTRDGLAEPLCDLTGNPKDFLSKFENEVEGKGEASIQNSLELVRSMLAHVPNHGTKEILILFSGVTSSDSGDIQVLCDELKRKRIQTSCISLSGEIFVLKKITASTGGRFEVPVNDFHFIELLEAFVDPPAAALSEKGNLSFLIPMGFPNKVAHIPESLNAYCACHGRAIESSGNYCCPKCRSKLCQVPTDCPVCGMTLITAPYLAKSYHHLFPVPIFESFANVTNDITCHSCQKPTKQASSENTIKVGACQSRCTKCSGIFCADCDIFIHEVLFNCPKCLET